MIINSWRKKRVCLCYWFESEPETPTSRAPSFELALKICAERRNSAKRRVSKRRGSNLQSVSSFKILLLNKSEPSSPPLWAEQNEAAISPSVTSPPLLYSPKLQFSYKPLSLQSPAWKLFYQSPGAAKQNPQKRWWKTDTADCKNLKTFVSGIMHEPRE